MKIRINGKEIDVNQGALSYEEIVELASPRPRMTVVFKDGLDEPEGILSPGERVIVKDGTKIEVADTGNA